MSDNILYKEQDLAFEPDPRGLAVLFLEKMRLHSEKVAQIDAATDESHTHGEMLSQSIKVAQNLRKMGINSDEIIALCANNTLTSFIAFLAAVFLEIPISPINPTLDSKECSKLLEIIKPRLLFCEDSCVEMMEESLKMVGLECEIIVIGETAKYRPFSSLLVSEESEESFTVEPTKDMFKTAVILFSSGTTGLSKAICLTQYGLLHRQLTVKYGHNVQMGMYFTGLFWVTGIVGLFFGILEGGIRLLFKNFDPVKTLQCVEKYGVTYTLMSPYLIHKLVHNLSISNYDLSSVCCVHYGGGLVTETNHLLLKKYFPNAMVLNGYGMTEASGLVTTFNVLTDKDLIEKKLNSVGFVTSGSHLKIVDVETEEVLGPNKNGEIRIKGNFLMAGYYNNPEAMKKAYDADGYLCTGDVGYYDEDKCIYVVDRVKELFKFRSWHIVPAELEAILLSHPAVQEAAVIGIPHEEDREHPMGVVVLKPGIQITEEELLNFFNDQVIDRKRLRAGIKFVHSLPYTVTGKLRRMELRNSIIKEVTN